MTLLAALLVLAALFLGDRLISRRARRRQQDQTRADLERARPWSRAEALAHNPTPKGRAR